MKALSIQQPWAWAIVSGHKPVENRTWHTNFRGWFLIHAGKKYDMEGERFLEEAMGIKVPRGLPRGGIVGGAYLADCVMDHSSDFFFGPHGFVLSNPYMLTFYPIRGHLGFFNVEWPPKEGREHNEIPTRSMPHA